VKQGNKLKKEYLSINIQLGLNNNHLSCLKHIAETGHQINFELPKILAKNSHVRPRRFLEAFYTKYNPNSFNRSLQFSEIYDPTIK
jgi:hypothetical protein